VRFFLLALPVIEYFDIFGNLLNGLLPCYESPMIHQFGCKQQFLKQHQPFDINHKKTEFSLSETTRNVKIGACFLVEMVIYRCSYSVKLSIKPICLKQACYLNYVWNRSSL